MQQGHSVCMYVWVSTLRLSVWVSKIFLYLLRHWPAFKEYPTQHWRCSCGQTPECAIAYVCVTDLSFTTNLKQKHMSVLLIYPSQTTWNKSICLCYWSVLHNQPGTKAYVGVTVLRHQPEPITHVCVTALSFINNLKQ